MTVLTRASVAAPLGPITAVLRAMQARHGATATHGLAPDLLVAEPLLGGAADWMPATALLDGSRLPELLAAAKHRWGAAPHAAAALAWKSYTYWLALPTVLGWASARRVPLLDPADVLVRFTDHKPLVAVGLRKANVAVLPSDPLVATATSGVRVVADESELLDVLRGTLLDNHLIPLLDQLRREIHIGQRTLLGSVASGVAYGLIRASDVLPGSTVENVGAILDALGVADLVSVVEGPGGELTVQRRTCCLAFTLPEPKICSGCCIRTAD